MSRLRTDDPTPVDVEAVCGPCKLGAHRWCSRVLRLTAGDDADCACLAADEGAHPAGDEGATKADQVRDEVRWSEVSLPRRVVGLALTVLTVLLCADFAIDDAPTVNGQLGLILAMPAGAVFVLRHWIGTALAGGAR